MANLEGYENAVIYRIRCENRAVKKTYIGSTKNIKRRTREHHRNTTNPFCKEYNSPVYTYIRENGYWRNWAIDVIAQVDCDNLVALKTVEREYIENGTDLLNVCIPLQTQKEYYDKNALKICKQKRDHYTIHAVQINTRKRQEYKDNYLNQRERKREYYKQKRMKMLEQNEIAALSVGYCDLEENQHGDQNRLVVCCCGLEMNYGSLFVHRDSQGHKDWVALINM